MPEIGVIFEVRRVETLPGETVRVSGECQELGQWDPSKSASDPHENNGKVGDILRLRTGPLSYPRWFSPALVWIQLDDGCHTLVNGSEWTSESGSDAIAHL